LSGGMAGVRERLDLFGVAVLAVVVGLAGGITRDLLIGVPPETFRDWRYLAVAGAAGFVTFLAHPFLSRIRRPIDVLDAAGLAVFCVTGASTALDHGLAAAPAVILGAITGIGGGILRDILVRQTPVVLREGLYAIPALIGAAIVVGAAHAGVHGPAAPIIGATICFVIRLAGLTLGLNIPRARHINRE
ncbi:MAG TPA: TRIC cation channel family protein, partial [Actinomycetota bacterium]|nr:TRIC cation channel family protein [Actinomycetota bacterium]